MKNEVIRVAVAETSVIIRSGLVSVLKHLPDVEVQPVEVTTPEGLTSCMQAHTPDILIVNPTFGGWFNLETLQGSVETSAFKTIALICNITDQTLLKDYDDSITLFDNIQVINDKIKALLHSEEESEDMENEQEALSQREKEVLVCVVKGLMNKEIADTLHISIHTVITHRRNITRKLQIHSSAGLTIYAIVNKLVELNEIKL